MKELGIEIISPICHYNSMNPQKNADIHKNKGIRIKNLNGLRFQENRGLFLRFQDNEFIIVVFSLKREKGGFYT